MAGWTLVLAAMAGLEKRVKRWRAALHLAVSALLVATAGFVSIPSARAAAATATLSVAHAWQTGFIAHFAISNASAVPLTNWTLEFDMPAGQSISHAWNSTVTQSGTHFVVTPANWNSTIEPGGSATGGFRGVLTGSYAPPSNCVLNRQYFCT